MASYNIRKAVGLDWRRDPARTLRVAGGIGADVIALQEADKRLGLRPAALPTDLIAGAGWRVAPVGGAGGLGWHGNALLLGPDVRHLWSEGIDLPGFEPRGALLTGLEVRGRPLVVAAVHLGLLRRHRRAQLVHLMDRLDGLALPVMIAGDFNEWHPAAGLEPLARDFDIHAPGRSFHAARPVASLDRIAVPKGIGLAGGGVLQSAEARRASDHLPIWADVMLPG